MSKHWIFSQQSESAAFKAVNINSQIAHVKTINVILSCKIPYTSGGTAVSDVSGNIYIVHASDTPSGLSMYSVSSETSETFNTFLTSFNDETAGMYGIIQPTPLLSKHTPIMGRITGINLAMITMIVGETTCLILLRLTKWKWVLRVESFLRGEKYTESSLKWGKV